MTKKAKYPPRAKLISERFRHVLPDSGAKVAILPYALASIVLHTFPDQWLRINVQFPHILDVEDPTVFLQVPIDGRILPLQEAMLYRFVLIG